MGNERAEHTTSSPLAIGCFPTMMAQNAVLNSLFRQWLIFWHKRCEAEPEASVNKKASRPPSVYRFCPHFSLMTFIYPPLFANLLATQEGYRDLDFFTRNKRHFYYLFNMLFEIRALNAREGFNAECFSPTLPELKNVGYAHRIEKAGLAVQNIYPVLIRPRTELCLQKLAQTKNINLENDLLPLYFWMTLTGELKARLKCKQAMRELFNDEADEAPFDEDEEICDVEPERYVNVFANIKDVLTKSERFATRYKAFVDEFFKNESKDYVD